MNSIVRLSLWFKAQIGTTENPPGSNNVVYNTDYYGNPVSGDAFPWCVTFVWDGFHQCRLSALFCGGIKTASCAYVADWARRHHRWVSAGYREGDLPLFDWDRDGIPDHIAYCVGAAGTTMTTIDGNSGDAVRQIVRPAADAIGAYRPGYE